MGGIGPPNPGGGSLNPGGGMLGLKPNLGTAPGVRPPGRVGADGELNTTPEKHNNSDIKIVCAICNDNLN